MRIYINWFVVIFVTSGCDTWACKGRASVEVLDTQGNHVCYLAPLPVRRWGHCPFDHTVCGGTGEQALQTSCVAFAAGIYFKILFCLHDGKIINAIFGTCKLN